MKLASFLIQRFDADEGKVFDWKEPRFTEAEDGAQVEEHLYAKTLWIGEYDSIENYIEVDAPVEEAIEE